jgi:hypothetical protein
MTAQQMVAVKQQGFSDRADCLCQQRQRRPGAHYPQSLGGDPCLQNCRHLRAEFEAYTPYYYSTYEDETEVLPSDRRKVMILGGGPNRIGQGIEFDYCCCHASFALRADDFETIMVNSNPETVSTDYDTSDRLYFEPLTKEDVLNIIEAEHPEGIIIQFGGQTPLKLAVPLQAILKGQARSRGASHPDPSPQRSRPKFGAPHPTPLTSPKTGSGLSTSCGSWTSATPQRHRPQLRRSPDKIAARSTIPWWCAPAMCWGGGPWKSSTPTRSLSTT